jgi:hypothetical protein
MLHEGLKAEDITAEKQSMPYDIFTAENSLASCDANIIINLSATNEQIKEDFNHWLKFYRKQLSVGPIKNDFSQKDFTKWIKWRLIPYLDLKLISMYEDKELSLVEIAGLLYGDEYDVDIVERVRRTTKPKAEWLINGIIDETMQNQLISKGN